MALNRNDMGVARGAVAYDAALEAEGQGCCSVSELDGAAGIGVVIRHGAQEGRVLVEIVYQHVVRSNV